MSSVWWFIGTVFVAMLCALLSGEVKAGVRAFAKLLVLNAAGRVHATIQERYREEWLAELEYKTSEGRDLGQLLWAFNIWLRVTPLNESLEGENAENLSYEELQRQLAFYSKWIRPLWRIHGVMPWLPAAFVLSAYGFQWLTTGKIYGLGLWFAVANFTTIFLSACVLDVYRHYNRRTLYLCVIIFRRYQPDSPYLIECQEKLEKA